MQKLRPPTWRRSRTPTPVEMRASLSNSSSAGTTGVGSVPDAATGSNSLSRQASLNIATTSATTASDSPSPSPRPYPQHLLLPFDPTISAALGGGAGRGHNSRARSRSFDCSTPQHQQQQQQQHESAATQGVGTAGGTELTSPSPSSSSHFHHPQHHHQGQGGGHHHYYGTGPLFGMLRRSFSRHSSAASSTDPPISNSQQGGSCGGGGGGGGSSSGTGSAVCIHCLCVEEYERLQSLEGGSGGHGGGSAATQHLPHYRRSNSPLGCTEAVESEYDDGDEDNDDSYPSGDDDGGEACGGGGAGSAPESEDAEEAASYSTGGLRLSFLGESFECRQKVEPWIRNQMLNQDVAGLDVGRAVMRRGRSLGLAPPSAVQQAEAALHDDLHGLRGHQFRRGGSECQPDPFQQHVAVSVFHHPIASSRPNTQQQQQLQQPGNDGGGGGSFNFSFSSSSGGGEAPSTSLYQVSSSEGAASWATPISSSGRRSPGVTGTPRLARQEALCSSAGWLENESASLDLVVPQALYPGYGGGASGGYRSHASMETHASASLEVDSGASGVLHRTSLESQSSLPTLSLSTTGTGGTDVFGGQQLRLSSLESDNSLESAGRGIAGIFQQPLHLHRHDHLQEQQQGQQQGLPTRSSLLARRKCLSAGASPNSSPPCSLSAKSSGYPGRLNLCATGSSSEYGDAAISPSPPAEIYLTVPILTPAVTPSQQQPPSQSPLAGGSSSGSNHKPSFLLRQRFRSRNDSSRSSSDKDSSSVHLPPPPPPLLPLTPLPHSSTPPLTARQLAGSGASASVCAVSSSASTSALQLHQRGLSRSGDSLHPRVEPPLRSRSIEIGLPTAHHHPQPPHHHQRTEYHDLAGSARRQQWVSRLK